MAELVEHMAENGLQFAPATRGSEGVYQSLHRALADYQTSMLTHIDTRAAAVATAK